jgi:hypothetical protein
MAAIIRVSCRYGAPQSLEWLAELNRSFHPPHALVDGNETRLNWEKPTDIEVSSGETHKLEVYFNVFPNNLLRVCGAEMEIAALREGEVHSLEYFVELKDRYLNRGHLKPLIGS